MENDIETNVSRLLSMTAENPFGEKVTLVAATKTRTPGEIARAIGAGITDIGENRVQEFRDKYDLVQGARRHFIGRLQRNKVKYLIGKADLIHSVDSFELAEEIARRSERQGAPSDILLEVNIGEEAAKGGFLPQEAESAYRRIKMLDGVRIRGFMTVLPASGDRAFLCRLADRMRALFERTRDGDPRIAYLSMGMSSDFELCISRGSNLVRLGTAIFGPRTETRGFGAR